MQQGTAPSLTVLFFSMSRMLALKFHCKEKSKTRFFPIALCFKKQTSVTTQSKNIVTTNLHSSHTAIAFLYLQKSLNKMMQIGINSNIAAKETDHSQPLSIRYTLLYSLHNQVYLSFQIKGNNA